MIHYMTSDGIGQPWVANELQQLDRAGIPYRLHAMRRPIQIHFASAWAHDLAKQTNVIYPLGVLSAAWSLLSGPALFGRRFCSALANALLGQRENGRARVSSIAHFVVACDWARRCRRENVSHIHAQWAYSSATIGMYGAWLLGSTFSFTGHATDLFRDRCALRDKIRRAQFIVCISRFHREFFLKEGARPEQLHIAYCGIDPELFKVQERRREPGAPIRIISSGRLVEKKGFADLLTACNLLRTQGIDFHCVIAGSGPLEASLRDQAAHLGLDDQVQITGQPLRQEDIPQFMHSGDVYCLPCVWASDNDVDGLPQMLMEAMACGCAVVSTRLVGIPDLVVDSETGLLVEPRDPESLARAIALLGQDQELSERCRRAGRRLIEERFDIATSLEPLIKQYREILRLQGSDTAAAHSLLLKSGAEA